MNSLPGNDHAAVSKFRAEGVQEWQADEGQTDAACIAAAIDANTEATLALAHEQRTATLVNVVRMYADLGMAEQAAGIIDAITNRLGGHDHE